VKRQRHSIERHSKSKMMALAKVVSCSILHRRRTIHSVPSVRILEANLAPVEAWFPITPALPPGPLTASTNPSLRTSLQIWKAPEEKQRSRVIEIVNRTSMEPQCLAWPDVSDSLLLDSYSPPPVVAVSADSDERYSSLAIRRKTNLSWEIREDDRRVLLDGRREIC